uniref:Nascent polypeptide-associated complex subunit beta n=1 Tax=Alexandrium catenella TaxID=2925 RepID=A0A7S1PJI6_ALECA|mmetsp:Transcript_100198/g.266362  ORF Transcript_100198/g.266362 Transcript_100198/m.266362 type:complete len:162 (+) Transcript_100198:74-559(+)
MELSPEVQAAREKMKQRFDAVRTGGKGTARRRKLAKHQSHAADDKQLQAQLKRLGVNAIPGIEEVNMFTDTGSVIHFAAPKVQASVSANTYVITGHSENKRLEELLPGIINQLGPDNLMNLKRIAEGYAAGAGAKASAAASDEKDEDIPEIGENFEDVSNK